MTAFGAYASEWVGSAYGAIAGAVRGVSRPPGRREVRIEGRDGAAATLRLHSSAVTGMDTIAAQLMRGGYEPMTKSLFQRLLPPGAMLVDVGANVGYFTVLGALLVGPRGKVLAFEPEPRNHAVLAANVAANALSQVTVRREACSDRPGRHFLAVNRVESGWHRLARADGSTGPHRKVPVELTTVDLALADVDRPVDVVKIDVEGHEASVVAGMAATLEANPEITVILEHSPAQARLCGLDPTAAVAWLWEAGLNHTYIVREKSLRLDRVTTGDTAALAHTGGRSVNLVLRRSPWRD